MSTKYPAMYGVRAMRKLLAARLSSMRLVRSPERSRHARLRRQLLATPILLGVALAVVLARPARSLAEVPCTDTFVGANNAKWTEAANWSDGYVPTPEEVVCIPHDITASLWFMTEVPAFVSIRAIRGGSVFSNTELYFTGPASEAPTEMEELAFEGTKVMVDEGSEVRLSHELFINGYSSIAGRGRIVLEPGAVGELGEVGCTTLNIDNTRIVNRGALHVGRRYVGGMIIALLGEAQIINEGVLGMDTQVNEVEDCPPRGQQGATIFRQAPTWPYVSEAIINTGTFETEWGANTSTIGVPVTNDGTIVAREGALAFSAGSVPTECSTGTWESDGAPLTFTGGSFNIAPGVNLAAVAVQGGASVDGCPAPKPPSLPAPGKAPTTGGAEGGSEDTPAKDESAEELGQGSKPLAAMSCVVPRLHAGTTLRRARKLLVARHCRLGRIYHLASHKIRPGRVIALRAHAGARLPHDAAVAILIAETPRVVTTHVGYV